MRHFLFFLLFILSAGTSLTASNIYTVGTYNLRICTPKDTDAKSWSIRKEFIARNIHQIDYDIFGVQELINVEQEHDLMLLLPDYDIISWGRDSNSQKAGEMIGIIYKKSRFDVLQQQHFFLSETPEIASKGWDSRKARLCIYTKMRDKQSGEEFYFFSTHFDHKGTVAREESAKLITQKVNEIAGKLPVFLVGDFNVPSTNGHVYQHFLTTFNDCRTVSRTTPQGTVGTLISGFAPVATYEDTNDKKIDFIYNKGAIIYDYRVINEDFGRGISPSDHFPVVVTCSFNELKQTNPIVLGNKRITLISPTLFRLEYAENAQFVDEPTMFAYDRSHLLTDYQITPIEGGKRYEIKTAALRMIFDNDNLPFGQINNCIFFHKDGQEKKINARNLHSKTRNLNLGGSVATLDKVSGEIPLDDGLLSEDGWYYIIDTGNELLKDGWFVERAASHVQDQYCFIYGDNYRTAFTDLGLISGKVPMTRKYMHGIWYSRWYPFDDAYINDLIKGYRTNNFPIDVLSMDMDWHLIDEAQTGIGHNYTKGWTGYTWNKKRLPDPKALVGSLLKDSIYVCLNEHPHDGIRPHESVYADFMNSMGLSADTPPLLFDAGNKKYMQNFLKYAHKEGNDAGISFWWLDWQQDYLYPYVRGSHMNHLKWINKLYFEDSMQGNRRGAGYSRWGGWGDHRYPINFSGDATANWDVLRFEVKLSQTSGNAGCYFWAHDIGGFHGGTNPELLVRWTQFGALSAALRVHAARGADLDRRPWIWGEQATEAMRTAYHFRSEILPYIYSSIWQTHNTLVPLNRCMFVDYGNDKNAYNRYSQFMLGDLLLAAPITHTGEGQDFIAQQSVWFPKGCCWYDYFTDQAYNGGDSVVVSKSIYEFPIFVKGGYMLPKQLYSDRPASAPLSTLVLRVYPGLNGDNNSYTLYEDDGESRDYEKGRYAETELVYMQKDNHVTLTVQPTKGEYNGQLTSRAYRIELAGWNTITQVKINGKKYKVNQDSVSGRYILTVNNKSIHTPTTITFTIND